MTFENFDNTIVLDVVYVLAFLCQMIAEGVRNITVGQFCRSFHSSVDCMVEKKIEKKLIWEIPRLLPTESRFFFCLSGTDRFQERAIHPISTTNRLLPRSKFTKRNEFFFLLPLL